MASKVHRLSSHKVLQKISVSQLRESRNQATVLKLESKQQIPTTLLSNFKGGKQKKPEESRDTINRLNPKMNHDITASTTVSSVQNANYFKAYIGIGDQQQNSQRQSATPKKQLTRHDYLFSTSSSHTSTTFSGLKIRDKNETNFKQGFTIPSEVLKPAKKLFAGKQKSYKEIDLQVQEYAKNNRIEPSYDFSIDSTILSERKQGKAYARLQSRSRDPLLEGESDLNTSVHSRKHVKLETKVCERINKMHNPKFNFFSPQQNISALKQEHLNAKFSSNVFTTIDAEAISKVLKGIQSCRNINKDIMYKEKRKTQNQPWSQSTIKGVIREQDEGATSVERNSFKITTRESGQFLSNPLRINESVRQIRESSRDSYREIKLKNQSSNIF